MCCADCLIHPWHHVLNFFLSPSVSLSLSSTINDEWIVACVSDKVSEDLVRAVLEASKCTNFGKQWENEKMETETELFHYLPPLLWPKRLSAWWKTELFEGHGLPRLILKHDCHDRGHLGSQTVCCQDLQLSDLAPRCSSCQLWWKSAVLSVFSFCDQNT